MALRPLKEEYFIWISEILVESFQDKYGRPSHFKSERIPR